MSTFKPDGSDLFTADEIEEAIHLALREGDIKDIPGLIKMLAIRDADRGQDMLDSLQIALTLAQVQVNPQNQGDEP